MFSEDNFYQGGEEVILPPREEIMIAVKTMLDLEISQNNGNDSLELNEIFISNVAKNIEGGEKYFRTDGILQEFYKKLAPVIYEILSSTEYSNLRIPERWKNAYGSRDNKQKIVSSVNNTSEEGIVSSIAKDGAGEENWGVGKGVKEQTEDELDEEARRLHEWRKK